MSVNPSETVGIQILLEEIQRTISDNRLFLKKLKNDDADLDLEEKESDKMDTPEDDFEEL